MGTVANGNTVSVHYRGTLNDGTEFDSSRQRGETLTFLVGSGQMIAGFDAAVLGMTIDEIKNISISPEEAYGELNPKAVQEISKESFPPEFEFVIGATVQGQGPNGPVLAKIISEQEEIAILDFNHPLAGETLNFEIEMVNITDSNDNEDD